MQLIRWNCEHQINQSRSLLYVEWRVLEPMRFALWATRYSPQWHGQPVLLTTSNRSCVQIISMPIEVAIEDMQKKTQELAFAHPPGPIRCQDAADGAAGLRGHHCQPGELEFWASAAHAITLQTASHPGPQGCYVIAFQEIRLVMGFAVLCW